MRNAGRKTGRTKSPPKTLTPSPVQSRERVAGEARAPANRHGRENVTHPNRADVAAGDDAFAVRPRSRDGGTRGARSCLARWRRSGSLAGWGNALARSEVNSHAPNCFCLAP